MVRHVDMWDSINQQAPFSAEAFSELVAQMLPDVTKTGVQILKGGAKEELEFSIVRRTAAFEIRKYENFDYIETVRV